MKGVVDVRMSMKLPHVKIGRARGAGAVVAAVACLGAAPAAVAAAPGALDRTFSGDGKATAGFGGNDAVGAVAVQPDGKIVTVGSSSDPVDEASRVVVARYLSTGVPDPSFSGDGVLSFPGVDDPGVRTVAAVR